MSRIFTTGFRFWFALVLIFSGTISELISASKYKPKTFTVASHFGGLIRLFGLLYFLAGYYPVLQPDFIFTENFVHDSSDPGDYWCKLVHRWEEVSKVDPNFKPEPEDVLQKYWISLFSYRLFSLLILFLLFFLSLKLILLPNVDNAFILTYVILIRA